MAGQGARIYQNDVGTEFYLETGEDLTAASALKIFVQRPDGTQVEWTGAAALNPDPDTDPLLGPTCIKYTFKTGDVAQVGPYMAHGHATFTAGSWTSNLASFQVYERFAA